MIARHTVALACGCLIVGNCTLSHAQTDTGPAEITYGPFSIEPLITAELTYDDNIFRSAANEVDSWVTRMKPILKTTIQDDGQVFTFDYDGDYGFYADSGNDDYDDHNFHAAADLNFGYSNHLRLDAAYTIGHQDRGTEITEGFDPTNPIIDTPIRLNAAELDAEYAYGSMESTNRIVLTGRYLDVRYQNYPDLTRYLDLDGTGASATYYHRVRPATSLLAEIKAEDVTYDLTRPGTASLDSRSVRYRVGATWEITDRTNSTIKLGQVDRKFDDKGREDFSAFDWDVNLRWSPRSYSHIDLVTARPVEEAYGGADFIDTKLFAVTWTHGWTERLETRIGAAYKKEVFEGSIREQETQGYSIALIHHWRRWLSFEFGAGFSDRDSNIERLMFDRNIYWLGARLSL